MKAKVYFCLTATDDGLISSHLSLLKEKITNDGEDYYELLELLTQELGGKIRHIEDAFEEVILRDNVLIKSEVLPYINAGTIVGNGCFDYIKHRKQAESFLRDKSFGILYIDLHDTKTMEVTLVGAEDHYDFTEKFLKGDFKF
jgi:hypothetical protein